VEAEFEAVLKQYGGICRGVALEYAKKSLRSDADFDDYMQEITLALYDAWRQNKAPHSTSAAYLTCKQAAYAYAAKSKGCGIGRNSYAKWRETNPVSNRVEYLPEIHDDVQSTYDECASTALANDFLDHLTPVQKRVVLYKVAGYHDNDIARICRTSKRSIERGRNSLRNSFVEYFGYDPRKRGIAA
jgi:DNA-directed RNA polymerase specialized sigma24 family protein